MSEVNPNVFNFVYSKVRQNLWSNGQIRNYACCTYFPSGFRTQMGTYLRKMQLIVNYPNGHGQNCDSSDFKRKLIFYRVSLPSRRFVVCQKYFHGKKVQSWSEERRNMTRNGKTHTFTDLLGFQGHWIRIFQGLRRRLFNSASAVISVIDTSANMLILSWVRNFSEKCFKVWNWIFSCKT